MSIKCLIIDDEPMALEKLGSYIGRIPYLELVASCSCAYDAMKVLQENQVDAIFVDINMPDVNGLEFVRALTDPPLVVFTTAYPDYAVDSYKVRAVDYLLKPYGFEDFQRTAGNLHKQFSLLNQGSAVSEETSDVIYLKVDYRYVRVRIDDIIYIEGMNEYLKIHVKGVAPLLVHTTFRQMLESLPSTFLQVHRSYMVNMNHVAEVERSVILLDNGVHVSVSEGNKEAFMQYLLKRSIRK